MQLFESTKWGEQRRYWDNAIVLVRASVGRDLMIRLSFFGVLLATGVAAAPLHYVQRNNPEALYGFALLSDAARMAPLPKTLIAGEAAPMPEPGELFRDCPDCPEMVVVPPGEFDMGSADSPFEKPPHKVAIAKSFAIERRETSFSEWDACVADGGCKYRPDDRGWGRGDQPVIDVSWDDAKAFIAWLTQKTGRPYRLPSEAEWEYAARAGTTSKFWWGREVGKANANCADCENPPLRKTVRTGSFRPNGFGLYDTSGNAYEWVEDCWNDNYAKAPKDGSAWNSGQCPQRVLRGGSFANQSNTVTSAARFRYDLDVRYYANGFRVVRDLR
jgi:formylglycine-generating enzyme required for sulfatase activity